jgi:tyrosine-protein kinase Etk/Wzc
MADYLAGDDSVEEERVGDNLNFMPRGRATDRAAELLATPRLREFLAKASASYDVVVLDSPPVLPVTDASLVARHAGVRLLVMRSQQTHLKAVRAAVRSLDGLGCAIHGAILNGVRSEESGYHGYDGQYRYYGPREARPRRLRLTW